MGDAVIAGVGGGIGEREGVGPGEACIGRLGVDDVVIRADGSAEIIERGPDGDPEAGGIRREVNAEVVAGIGSGVRI